MLIVNNVLAKILEDNRIKTVHRKYRVLGIVESISTPEAVHKMWIRDCENIVMARGPSKSSQSDRIVPPSDLIVLTRENQNNSEAN
jgi:hypothetical protein